MVKVKGIERKITQVGNSLGLTVPTHMLEALGVKKGDDVIVELKHDQLLVKKAPTMVELPEGVPVDFFEVLEKEMEAHDEALKGLVNR